MAALSHSLEIREFTVGSDEATFVIGKLMSAGTKWMRRQMWWIGLQEREPLPPVVTGSCSS